MTGAVRAGRVLAWLIATGCVLIFAALVRRIVRDWRIALMATFAFAFSGGIAVHSRILRSELVAACPVIFALMVLIVVGRSSSIARPLWMAVAAGLCILGLENKVQAILLIGVLPLLCCRSAARKRERCVVAQPTIKLVRSGYCGRRSDCLGLGGVAADFSRL